MAANMSVRGTAIDNVKPILEAAATSGSIAGGFAVYNQWLQFGGAVFALLIAISTFIYWVFWKPYIELKKVRISEKESNELIELNKQRAKEEFERLNEYKDFALKEDRRKKISSKEVLELVINDEEVLKELKNRLQINKTNLEKE